MATKAMLDALQAEIDALRTERDALLERLAHLDACRTTRRVLPQAPAAHDWERHVSERYYGCRKCGLMCYEPHTVLEDCAKGYMKRRRSRKTKAS